MESSARLELSAKLQCSVDAGGRETSVIISDNSNQTECQLGRWNFLKNRMIYESSSTVVVAMMLLRLKIVRTSADLEIPRIAVVVVRVRLFSALHFLLAYLEMVSRQFFNNSPTANFVVKKSVLRLRGS